MASLIDNMDLIQGDSSTIFKFGESTGKELDTNWEASFAIIETDPNTPIISITLSKDDENMNFIFQILPNAKDPEDDLSFVRYKIYIRKETIFEESNNIDFTWVYLDTLAKLKSCCFVLSVL